MHILQIDYFSPRSIILIKKTENHSQLVKIREKQIGIWTFAHTHIDRINKRERYNVTQLYWKNESVLVALVGFRLTEIENVHFVSCMCVLTRYFPALARPAFQSFSWSAILKLEK